MYDLHMRATTTGESFVPESQLVPGLTINEFVLTGLDKRMVGATNAGRLLAGDICLELVDETKEKLHDVTSHGNGEAGPGEIIAPLLRVTEDFRDEDAYVHATKGSHWERYTMWAIDEVTDTPIVEVEPGLRTDINPRSISVFPAYDYNKLLKQTGLRRPLGHASAFRFALGLSIFDPLYQESHAPIKQAHRHFDLLWKPDSFRKS